MQFLVNSRLADGAGRDQLIEYFGQHHIDSSTWDLVRHHVVADHMFKGSDEPGVILVRDVDTSGEAEEATKAPPAVEHVLLRFELDPVSAITHSPNRRLRSYRTIPPEHSGTLPGESAP